MKMGKRLLSYSKPYTLWLSLAFGLIMFTSLAINYLPVLIQKITDECLMPSEIPVDKRIELLVQLGILYISIAAVGHFFRYIQAMLTAWIGQKIIYDLRISVFRKVMRLHQGYFDNTAVGTLMNRISSGCSTSSQKALSAPLLISL
jgi:ATP-binding cassette subfamily B protein